MEKIKEFGSWLIKTHLGRLTLAAILVIVGGCLYSYLNIETAIYLAYIGGAYIVGMFFVMMFYAIRGSIDDLKAPQNQRNYKAPVKKTPKKNDKKSK